MSNMPPEVQVELSEEEFELDPSAEGVDVAQVQTNDNADVDSQDPEAQGSGHATVGG